MRSCWTLRFSVVEILLNPKIFCCFKDLKILLPGLRFLLALLSLSFPTVFLLRLSGLRTKKSFPLLLIDYFISWCCHFYQPHAPASFQPLLYLVCYEADVCFSLNFKVTVNFEFLTSSFCSIFSTLYSLYFSDAGVWFF